MLWLAWGGLNLHAMLHLPWCGIKCWLPWCGINLKLAWGGLNLHAMLHLPWGCGIKCWLPWGCGINLCSALPWGCGINFKFRGIVFSGDQGSDRQPVIY